jgi:hypothetical protein
MRWVRLRSNVIRLVGHDPVSGELLLRFPGGKLYVFRDVDPDVVAEILEAKAPGIAFSATLRGSPYSERVEGFASATDALAWAREQGCASLSLTSAGRRRTLLRRLSVANLAKLAASLDTDQDCTGAHTWFFTGADRDRLSLWHVNDETGYVVPPTPRLAWRSAASASVSTP